jgi:TonB family protein
MFETWKDLEGAIVDERFRLGRCLGSTEAGAVFLLDGQEGPRTAIKLVACDQQSAEARLARLRAAERLSHPHLLRLLQAGHCRLGEGAFLYVLMEYAEENLGQLLPHRALTVKEAHELVRPLLDVLAYLHAQGFVHGHIQPSNTLAIEDQVKLSSDGLQAAGEVADLYRRSIHIPPEAATGEITAAADSWSLGTTLLEALTGQPPVFEGEEPVIPPTLPAPFLDVVRHCVRPDPRQRWTVAQIAARLEQRASIPPPVVAPVRPEPASPAEPQTEPTRRSPALVVSIAAVAVAAILGVFHLLGGRSGGGQTSSPSPATVPSMAEQDTPPAELPAAPAPVREQPASETVRPAIPLSLREETVSEARQEGSVIHRAMPNVSQAALNTIRGTVRVTIKVNVDGAGEVAETRFVSAGPSRYFADRAMQAAKLWQFRPVEVDGQGVPSEWTLRFEYRNSGTTVIPAQTAP